MVATVPERLAERLSTPFGLIDLPHPVKLPEVAINVLWHAEVHRSQAHEWLRAVVFDLFADSRAARCPSLGGESPLRDLALGDREIVREAVDALAVPELLGIGDFEFLLQAKVAAHQLIECHRLGLLKPTMRTGRLAPYPANRVAAIEARQRCQIVAVGNADMLRDGCARRP